MPKHILYLPDLGDFKDTPVIDILVNDGDAIEVDDSILVLESDKATMDIPAPRSGNIQKILVKVGDKVNSGDAYVEIESDELIDSDDHPGESMDSSPSEQSKELPELESKADQPNVEEDLITANPDSPLNTEHERSLSSEASQSPVVSNPQSYGGQFHASPKIRHLATQLGVDLRHLQGTGPMGRILENDVHEWVKNQLTKKSNGVQAELSSGRGIPEPPSVDFNQFGETESIELSRIQKISGVHLSKCWLNAPHVTQFTEVDIDDMERFRQQTNATNATINTKRQQTKITPLAFLIKAVAANLKEFPTFNASLSSDQQQLIMKKYFNIGFAVDTPNGLVVPVIREVDQKGIQQIADELGVLAVKARDGKLTKQDLSGGCFSISSLGSIGGRHFTPIINLPEVAILGVGKATIEPKWDGKKFRPRLTMPLSLSYDHRVIDGALGARFVVALEEKLTDLRQLVL